jgi:nitroreductase
MDVAAALRARRSCRAFLDTPVAPEVLGRVLDAARRGPTAGNSWALDLLVLDDPRSVERYWAITLPPQRRASFPWPGLLVAPVLVIPVIRREAYIERYAESDKAPTGLGVGADRWSVPYWWVDAGASVMAMLLAATEERLGSLLFGIFDNADFVSNEFGVPSDRELLGTLAFGHPDHSAERPSRSASRGRPVLDEIVHRGHWTSL